jgi:hypothetical protein
MLLDKPVMSQEEKDIIKDSIIAVSKFIRS